MGALFANLPYGIVGTQLASTLIGARATQLQGQATADAASFNARLALMEGQRESDRLRRAARAEIGSQRVAIGTSGVRFEGSPIERLAANAAALEREAMDVQVASRYTAGLERSRGKAARDQFRLAAAGQLGAGLARTGYTALRLLR